jgi:methionine sulfoxide reductase catalytic subunit
VLIRTTTKPAPPCSEITPFSAYRSRRRFIKDFGLLGSGLALSSASARAAVIPAAGSIESVPAPAFSTTEKQTELEFVAGYNNFYEFGTGKADPAANAGSLVTRPWAVAVGGEINDPRTLDLDELLKPHALEERVYRLRCVEAWSMVIPWIGFPLKDLIGRFDLRSNAKFVEFTTLHDPDQMPGQRRGVPLTILAVGLYGEVLPNQNGAPLRLVVPWKYGFKSIKSIVAIRFTEHMPDTAWNLSAPREYGFYSNVNPRVPHPRWSQAKERRIGEDGLFTPKRKTLMFNGYAEQVAHLYDGLDLRRNF